MPDPRYRVLRYFLQSAAYQLLDAAAQRDFVGFL